MSKTQLKKQLQTLDKTEIIEFVLDMYDSHKEYFKYYLNPDEREQFEKYKKVITKAIEDQNGPKIALAKKAIADFTRFKPSPELLAELMMHLVLEGCKLTYDYGDFSEQFYTSIANNYERALKYISANGFLEQFRDKAQQCLEYAEPCGYGFPYDLDDIFSEYYGDLRR